MILSVSLLHRITLSRWVYKTEENTVGAFRRLCRDLRCEWQRLSSQRKGCNRHQMFPEPILWPHAWITTLPVLARLDFFSDPGALLEQMPVMGARVFRRLLT